MSCIPRCPPAVASCYMSYGCSSRNPTTHPGWASVEFYLSPARNLTSWYHQSSHFLYSVLYTITRPGFATSNLYLSGTWGAYVCSDYLGNYYVSVTTAPSGNVQTVTYHLVWDKCIVIHSGGGMWIFPGTSFNVSSLEAVMRRVKKCMMITHCYLSYRKYRYHHRHVRLTTIDNTHVEQQLWNSRDNNKLVSYSYVNFKSRVSRLLSFKSVLHFFVGKEHD